MSSLLGRSRNLRASGRIVAALCVLVAFAAISAVAFAAPAGTTNAAVSSTVGGTAVALSRIGGGDRFETAALLSQSKFAAGSSDSVIIATGRDFPDALCAGGLAGAVSAPVLLTEKFGVPSTIMAEASRVTSGVAGPKAYIVGSESVVSAAVEQQLTGDGFTVVRLFGPDRYATAASVAGEIQTLKGGTFGNKAFVVRGDNFPDALAVGAFAYGQSMPILLTRTTALPDVTANAITDNGITDVVIAGSTSAVSATVANDIDALAGVNAPVRQGGANRYDTAAAIVDYGMAQGWGNAAYLGIASGTNFPDALAGGPVAGANGGVMLITNPTTLSPQTGAWITANKADITQCVIYGSSSAVSNGVFDPIVILLQ